MQTIGVTLPRSITNYNHVITLKKSKKYLNASSAHEFAVSQDAASAKKPLRELQFLVPNKESEIWKYSNKYGKRMGFGTLIEPYFRKKICCLFNQLIIKQYGGAYSNNCNFVAEMDGISVHGSTIHGWEFKNVLSCNNPNKFQEAMIIYKWQLALQFIVFDVFVDITFVIGFWEQVSFEQALKDVKNLVIYYVNISKYTFTHCLKANPPQILYFKDLKKLPSVCNEKIKDKSFIKKKKFLCYRFTKMQYKTYTRKDFRKEINYLKQKFESVKKGKKFDKFVC